MIHLTEEIISALADCPRVTRRYPAAQGQIPAVAVTLTGAKPAASADGAEYLTELTYALDSLAPTQMQALSLAARADLDMSALGLKRLSMRESFDARLRAHRVSAEYGAVCDQSKTIYAKE